MSTARSLFADFGQAVVGEMDLCPTTFFAPGTRERELLTTASVTCLEYVDSTIAVIKTTDNGWAERWCFGTAPHRQQSIVGVPIPDAESGFPDTREDVLEQLDLRSWHCWMPDVDGCEDQLRPGVQRRLQGAAGICWVPDKDFATVYAEMVGEQSIGEAFADIREKAIVEVADQTIHLEDGAELDRRDAIARRCDDTKEVTLRFETPTEIVVRGNGYQRRSLTLDPGVYFLSPLGALGGRSTTQRASTA
jgi:hypothetical protein